MWNLFISFQGFTVCFAKCLQLSLLNSNPPPSSGWWKLFLHSTSLLLFTDGCLFLELFPLVLAAAQRFSCSFTNSMLFSFFKFLLPPDNSALHSVSLPGSEEDLRTETNKFVRPGNSPKLSWQSFFIRVKFAQVNEKKCVHIRGKARTVYLNANSL